MAVKTVFVVQPFEKRQKKLIPLPKTDARSEEHARHQAEHMAARRAGAAVIVLDMDTETGEVSTAKILARFGTVPEDLDQVIESF